MGDKLNMSIANVDSTRCCTVLNLGFRMTGSNLINSKV